MDLNINEVMENTRNEKIVKKHNVEKHGKKKLGYFFVSWFK